MLQIANFQGIFESILDYDFTYFDDSSETTYDSHSNEFQVAGGCTSCDVQINIRPIENAASSKQPSSSAATTSILTTRLSTISSRQSDSPVETPSTEAPTSVTTPATDATQTIAASSTAASPPPESSSAASSSPESSSAAPSTPSS